MKRSTKKSITLIGELIGFLFLIVLGYFMGGIMVFIHRLNPPVPGDLTYELTVQASVLPVKHEDMMLSLLEATHDSIQVKKIIAAAAVQGNEIVYVDGNKIEIEDIANLLYQFEPEHGYLLKMELPEREIDIKWSQSDINKFKSYEDVLRIQKISTKIYTPFDYNGELEMLVR